MSAWSPQRNVLSKLSAKFPKFHWISKELESDSSFGLVKGNTAAAAAIRTCSFSHSSDHHGLAPLLFGFGYMSHCIPPPKKGSRTSTSGSQRLAFTFPASPTFMVSFFLLGLPLVGNIFDLGGDAFYVKARNWSKEYRTSHILAVLYFSCSSLFSSDDDVISLTILGHTTVVLNSAKAVADLFISRGANYSDRPDMPMLIDL